MKRRDYVLRSFWLALATGIPLARAQAQDHLANTLTEDEEREEEERDRLEEMRPPAPKEPGQVTLGTGGPSQRYRCTVSNYIYDPANGEPDAGYGAGTAFADLSDDWTCPECGASRADFEPITQDP